MKNPIQSDNLKLVLANGKGNEFFVRSMVLDEGFGIIPTARLELCSSVRGSVVEMDDLKRYLGSAATIEYKHVNIEGGGVSSVVSTRWMSGRVSSVEHLGVIDARNDGLDPVCGYRMTIRPSLSQLCLRRSRYQFANSTVRKVLETLLNSCCTGEYSFPSRGCPVLNATRDFSQGDETDYEFFVRVLASCGLSYHYQMNNAASLPTTPKLHIINALPSREQLSELETNYVSDDDSKVTLCYKLPMLDGCVGSMTAWEMSQSDGIGKCSVSFGDASGERLSCNRTVANYEDVVRLNHVPFDNIRSADEIKQEVDAFLKSMRRNVGVWLGVTSRLEARVGASLVLRGFYGKSGSDIKDLVIARTRVRLESPVPAGQLGPWGSVGWRQYVSVGCISGASDAATDFSALPTGRLGEDEAFGGTKSSGDFTHVEKTIPASPDTDGGATVQVSVEEDWRKTAVTVDAWQPTTQLVQATVCAADGSTSSTNNTSELRKRPVSDKEKEVFYEFHAKPDNASGREDKDKVMVVRYVQPVGGLGQGLFRVPRVGDRILVIRYSPCGSSVGGINYLMGYLPGKDMPHVTHWNEGNAKQMDALTIRYDQTETMKKDLCDGKGTADNEVNEYGKLTAAERFDGAASFRRGKKQNTFSELGFYDDHLSKIREQVDKSGPMKFHDVESRRGALANLQSTGDVQISANDRVEINARKIHIGCPGWETWREVEKKKTGGGTVKEWQVVDGTVEIDDINELVVRAKRRIVLNVGGSTLVIDKDGVAINASRWREANGCPLTTSTMTLSALKGINISGQKVAMTGQLGVSVSDFIGGSFSSDAGLVSTSGLIVRQQTKTFWGEFFSALGAIGTNFLPLGNLVTKDADPSAGSGMAAGEAIGGLLDIVFATYYNDTRLHGAESKAGLVAHSVLHMLAGLLTCSEMIVKSCVGAKKWEERLDPNVDISLGDIIMLCSALLRVGATAALWLGVTTKNAIRGKIVGAGSATVTLRTSGIAINAPNIDAFMVKAKSGNGPFAGKDANFKFASVSSMLPHEVH